VFHRGTSIRESSMCRQPRSIFGDTAVSSSRIFIDPLTVNTAMSNLTARHWPVVNIATRGGGLRKQNDGTMTVGAAHLRRALGKVSACIDRPIQPRQDSA
jgi:hypothetical protein